MTTGRKKIVLIATLDTKGEEARFVKELIEQRGHEPVVIDCGIRGKPPFEPTVSREAVARAAGTTLEEILLAIIRLINSLRSRRHPPVSRILGSQEQRWDAAK